MRKLQEVTKKLIGLLFLAINLYFIILITFSLEQTRLSSILSLLHPPKNLEINWHVT